jgi:hypothetical protein
MLFPPVAEGGKLIRLAFPGLRWWQNMKVIGFHETCLQVVICDCIAAEASGYRKSIFIARM